MAYLCEPHLTPIRLDVHIDESLTFKGKTLTDLANIMFNLLDNVRKYSNASQEGFVKLEMEHLQEVVMFRMTNSVKEELDIATFNNALSDIRETISAFRVMRRIPQDGVKREGRSGFYKIAKVLMFELLAECNVTFEYLKGGILQVECSVPANTLLT